MPLVNAGVASTYNNTAISDKTNLMNTFDSPPHDFDARNGDAPTRYRSSWHLATGIRGRAMVKSNTVEGDSTLAIENSIIQEGALELAFEGHRWGDLVRVAIRRNDLHSWQIRSMTNFASRTTRMLKLLDLD
jgi:hypothetical protein